MSKSFLVLVRTAAAVLTVVCAPTLFAEIGLETVFHVARTGNDTNDGGEGTPFISIVRAQQAAREKIAAGLTGNVRVLIHGGTYTLSQPLTFDPRDSGTTKFSITYAAVSNETVVINGGQRITGWTNNGGNVWTTELPEVKGGNWYFRNLYVNGHRATRARSPNAKDSAAYYTIKGFDKNNWAMTLGTNQVAAWKNLIDVEMVLIGPWSIIRKRITYADPATGTIITEMPHLGSSGMEEPGAGTSCYLENARAFLDQPGEWYLDRTAGVLSYWPRPGEDLAIAEVIAPRLTTLLQVHGTARQPVENLHFDGIHFYYADAAFPNHGYSGASCGYYRLDNFGITKAVARIDVAVYFEFAKSGSLKNGEIAHIGGNALHLSKGCSQMLIQENRLFDIGDNGIEIGDRPYPPAKPVPSLAIQNNSTSILNNDISDCGASYHDGVALVVRPAAQTSVSHNFIHDCPHHGIVVGTTSEVLPPGIADGYSIQNNEIKNVCQLLGDSGPIYVWGRQTSNNVISGNVIHDTRAYGAIYFDDDSSGYRVESNVVCNIEGRTIQFTNCRQESFVLRDNFWHGTNNFVRINNSYAVSFSGDKSLDCSHKLTLEPKQITIEAWVKLYQDPSGADPSAWVACKNTNELTDGNYSMLVSHQNVGAYLNIGGGRDNCYAAWSSTSPVSVGNWHLLAMSYDGTNLIVSCDGKVTGTATVNRPRSTGNGVLRIGKRADAVNSSFPGLMSAVQIYNRALSAGELAAHFAVGLPDAARPAPPDSNRVFHWSAAEEYQQVAPIFEQAGPQEPYRSRFRAAAGQ